MKKINFLFLIFFLFILSGCGNQAPAAPSSGQEPINSFSVAPGDYPVTILNNKFEPAEITFEPGTRVIWTNQDSVPHNIVSEDLPEIQSPVLQPGEKYELTITKKGTFDYSCGIHPDMKGVLNVK